MKTVSFKLGGKSRSLVVPSNAAAFAFREQTALGQAALILRMKKADDYSFLTSFRKAQVEIPGLNWLPVGSMGYLETNRGLDNNEPSFAILEFELIRGEWTLKLSGEMSQLLQSTRDLSPNLNVPQNVLSSKDEVLQFIAELTQQGQETTQ